MAKGLCPPFDARAYREGHLTPVFFGSALNKELDTSRRPVFQTRRTWILSGTLGASGFGRGVGRCAI
jgi:hypothetical protein